MEKIGLVAGSGELPVIFAREAKKRGINVVTFAINGMARKDIDLVCAKVHWLSVNQIKKFFFLLIAERIRKIVLLGKVDKSVIYNKKEIDSEELKVLKDSREKSDYFILEKITSEFSKRGVEVINGVEYLKDLFPPRGILTARQPSERESDDIAFGFKIAKEISKLDIGQTVVVKDKAIVSVEAMEGTDRAIERVREICVEDFVVVKTSRPNQDMRWDVPVVGPETVRLIAKNKGKILAIESDRMFLVDRDACVKIADENDMSIAVI